MPDTAQAAVDPELMQAIDARLEQRVAAAPSIAIPAGDTLFVVHEVPAPREARSLSDYEARLTGVVSPRGARVHPRADSVRAARNGRMRWVVVVHAEPGSSGKGTLKYELNLVERKGMGNSVFRNAFRSELTITRREASEQDLVRDFTGYRIYRARAIRSLKALRKLGLRVKLDEDEPIPPTGRLRPEDLALLTRFEQSRTRMWVAYRHLDQSRRFGRTDEKAIASAYWPNLNRPKSEWAGMPAIALEVTPPPPDQPLSRESEAGILAPIATYEPGSEGPATPNASRGPTPDEVLPGEAERRPEARVEAEPTRAPQSDRLPSYRRGLVLDDPNVGFGGGARFFFADAQTDERASTMALFYFAQAAATSDLGIEFTVPTQFVSLTDIDADNVYAAGNPLLAVKYRFHLPPLEGRRPALLAKMRFGMPISPPHKLRPSDFTAEQFTQPVYFVDTYAFLADYYDVGLGSSFVWSHGMLYVAAQLFLDYYIPLDSENQDLLALGYGASVGVLPWSWLGAFAEARATSLLTGLSRTEMVGYFGLRGVFWKVFQPAAFVGIPAGSIADVSTVQVGFELQATYDVGGRVRRKAVASEPKLTE